MKTQLDHDSKNRQNGANLKQEEVEFSSYPTTDLQDNRPAALIQRKLQQIANESPQADYLNNFQEIANKSQQSQQAGQFQKIANNSAPAPIQRYMSVHEVNFVKDKDPEFRLAKMIYLKQFNAIQRFLSNIERTKPHIDQLNERMGLMGNLSNLLNFSMPGWSREVPTLVDPVPRDLFVQEMVGGQKPKLFEDFVDQIRDGKMSHGVQSHRLQWYMIQQEFGSTKALELYKLSLDSDWVTDQNKTVWDLIVDAGGESQDQTDFTAPGNLHNYLVSQYQPEGRSPNRLANFLKEEQESFNDKKKALNLLRKNHMKKIEEYGPIPPGPTHDQESGKTLKHFTEKNGFWLPTTVQDSETFEEMFDASSIELSKLK